MACGHVPGLARKLRVEYPGAIYHVMNRGDRRELIFEDYDGAEAQEDFAGGVHSCLTKPYSLGSKRRAQNPRRKFFVADAGEFALGALAARDGNDFLKDAPTNLLDRLRAVKNRAGVDVHVLVHPIEERRVRRDFDARSGLAAIHAAAPGRAKRMPRLSFSFGETERRAAARACGCWKSQTGANKPAATAVELLRKRRRVSGKLFDYP